MEKEEQGFRRTAAWRQQKRDDTESAFRSISGLERNQRELKTAQLRKLREASEETPQTVEASRHEK